jgi:hypothetical protein
MLTLTSPVEQKPTCGILVDHMRRYLPEYVCDSSRDFGKYLLL